MRSDIINRESVLSGIDWETQRGIRQEYRGYAIGRRAVENSPSVLPLKCQKCKYRNKLEKSHDFISREATLESIDKEIMNHSDQGDKNGIYYARSYTVNAADAMPSCYNCWQTNKTRYIEWPQPIGWDTDEREEYIKMYDGKAFSAGVHMCLDRLEQSAKEGSIQKETDTDTMEPCPFCGKKPTIHTNRIIVGERPNYYISCGIMCDTCNYSPQFGQFKIHINVSKDGTPIINFDERDKAIRLWNVRNHSGEIND